MEIPIKFECEGKTYQGIFSLVNGSASNAMFHLYIGNFYHGQLFYSEYFGWQWGSNKGHFKGMADWFGGYIIAWVG